jgi:RNA:NAD 2'-phosphotransferase (TPT1/KptA family)
MNLPDLPAAVRFDRRDWALIDETFLKATIEDMERLEIGDGRIRATHGHSIEIGKLPPVVAPPPVLFHGTTEDALLAIRREGSKAKGRRLGSRLAPAVRSYQLRRQLSASWPMNHKCPT